MSVQIIVEDGTGYTNANSYVDLEYAVAYAADRGIDLGSDDNQLAILLIKAKDYLDAKRSKYQGVKTYDGQALQWPRNGVKIDGDYYSSTAIPVELKYAQCQLVIEAHNGVDLMPTIQGGQFVKRETIGPITTEYSETVGANLNPTLTAVEALLAPLVNPSAGLGLRTVRV